MTQLTTATTPAAPDEATVVRGGVHVPVKFVKKSQDPSLPDALCAEQVFVKVIPFLDVGTVLAPAWGDNLKEIIAYTGRDEAYARALLPSSQIEVLKEGRKLNFFTLSEHVKLQTESIALYGDQGQALQAALVEKATAQAMAALEKNKTPEP